MAYPKKSCNCAPKEEKKQNEPDPGLFPHSGSTLPDENVTEDGQCILPPYAESAGTGTGEPCVDALNEPAMQPHEKPRS